MKAKGHATAAAPTAEEEKRGREIKDAGAEKLRGETGGRGTWKKLPPHLRGHDVRAPAVSCHFGPQSSGAEVPPGSLPPSLQSHLESLLSLG